MFINILKKVYRGRLWLLPFWFVSGKAHTGFCTICERRTVFVKYHPWLRDNYRCIRCWSIPRQRAIVKQLSAMFPSLSGLRVHESSPEGVASHFIEASAGAYVPTHYFHDVPPGEMKGRFRSENLEHQSFKDGEFDLVVTQDVMEHVLDPARAFVEIARTLKPGGHHVFTVPIYKGTVTLIRACHDGSDGIHYLEEPDFHGNPIDESGSLVTREWGPDIVEVIEESCGMKTTVNTFNERESGLQAEFLDVLVSVKATMVESSNES